MKTINPILLPCLLALSSLAACADGDNNDARTRASQPALAPDAAQVRDATETLPSISLDEASFERLQAERPEYVAGLLTMQPARGRDRNVRFSQEVWSEPEAAVVLAHRLRDLNTPTEHRAAIASRLRGVQAPWHDMALRMLGTESEPLVRAGLMSSLSRAPEAFLGAAVLAGIQDADPFVRDWATVGAGRLIANHPDAAAREEVLQAMQARVTADGDEHVRAGALRALGMSRDADVAASIVAGLDDRSPMVRLAAVRALHRATPGEARAIVTAAGLSSDPDPKVARAVARL